jgi:Protein of unknown function (DUF1353)
MPRNSRRDFITGCAALQAAGLMTTCLPGARSAIAKHSTVTAEQWMDRWMSVDRAPGGILQISRFKEPMYFLLKPISWTPNRGQERNALVDVPIGFVTDFASIPRAFWSFLPTDGDYAYAAVIHDFLYWTQTRPRAAADEILKLAMQDFKIDRVIIEVVYRAVRVGGSSAWSANAKLKASGEGRVLKVFPTDPTTSWNDWKSRPGMFADV